MSDWRQKEPVEGKEADRRMWSPPLEEEMPLESARPTPASAATERLYRRALALTCVGAGVWLERHEYLSTTSGGIVWGLVSVLIILLYIRDVRREVEGRR